jgi:hypothetical protein
MVSADLIPDSTYSQANCPMLLQVQVEDTRNTVLWFRLPGEVLALASVGSHLQEL